ncbi:autotransporter outer membrane beta-barrel domain-containing protein [Chlamydia psittaci]|uniref:autotransporter outer membrane beta-barrel domain-containing protein n=1 Tax=Chlamydia psittaci TaxID=83554 RepID=UPI000FCBCF43|nr:autotransporter outer membrane beta-barrel domain-containing protein [Chlamydia psittaci]AZU10432.1 autotransporter outer membrane beta-barrel domain-containing protein [Chlamydia psittaci]
MISTITKYLTSISLTFALFTNLYAEDASQTSEVQESQDTQIKTDQKGDFISNIFWQSTYATLCGMNTSKVSLESLSNRAFNIEVGALGLCLYQKDIADKQGFHMDGAGYYAGISGESASMYKVGFHCVIQQANANANASHNEVATDYLSLGSHWQINCFRGKLILTGNYLYTQGNHQINHTHSELLGACYGSFESQTMGNTLSCYFPLKARTNHRLTVTPFLRYQAFSSKLNNFKEQGARIRTFVPSKGLLDVSFPFGLHNTLVFQGCCPSLWELEVTYKPTVIRRTPSVSSVLVADKGMWISSPTDVSYHAFSINLKNDIRLLKHLHIKCNYQCDISSSTCSHYLLAGGKLSF